MVLYQGNEEHGVRFRRSIDDHRFGVFLPDFRPNILFVFNDVVDFPFFILFIAPLGNFIEAIRSRLLFGHRHLQISAAPLLVFLQYLSPQNLVLSFRLANNHRSLRGLRLSFLEMLHSG